MYCFKCLAYLHALVYTEIYLNFIYSFNLCSACLGKDSVKEEIFQNTDDGEINIKFIEVVFICY